MENKLSIEQYDIYIPDEIFATWFCFHINILKIERYVFEGLPLK